jgi:competence ComEA-like helix-hairpin-helix protein
MLKEYFTFSKGERNAAIVLALLAVVLFIAPRVYFYFYPVGNAFTLPDNKAVSDFIAEYKARTQKDSMEDAGDNMAYNPFDNVKDYRPHKKEVIPVAYFDFDPNKIGEKEWQQLGFSEKQANTIEAYKAKGGKFYKPEDMKKLYVVNEEMYERLFPYIKIESTRQAEHTYEAKPMAEKKVFTIDINTADSSLFERQRGIGPTLARRIISYRNRLGGFVSVEQIREVWGMPDSTYQFLKQRMTCDAPSVAQIDINAADIETLRRHPYINYTFAKPIYNYRQQHGNYKSVSDLKSVAVITDSIFLKLQPYVKAE